MKLFILLAIALAHAAEEVADTADAWQTSSDADSRTWRSDVMHASNTMKQIKNKACKPPARTNLGRLGSPKQVQKHFYRLNNGNTRATYQFKFADGTVVYAGNANVGQKGGNWKIYCYRQGHNIATRGPHEQNDLDQKTIQKLRSAFKQADRDGGGTITTGGAYHALSMIFPTYSLPDFEDTLERESIRGAGKDKVVDLDEFECIAKKLYNIRKVYSEFRQYDKNHDLKMNRNELERALMQFYFKNVAKPGLIQTVTVRQQVKKTVDSIIKRHDKNHDGSVSWHEFEMDAFMEEHYNLGAKCKSSKTPLNRHEVGVVENLIRKFTKHGNKKKELSHSEWYQITSMLTEQEIDKANGAAKAPALGCRTPQQQNGQNHHGFGPNGGSNFGYTPGPGGYNGPHQLGGTNNGKAKNLHQCWGECDADSQCAKGLKCFQRSHGEHIPGCTGKGGGPDWDYCYDPKLAHVLGGPNDPKAKNLRACYGECDADSQCAKGLKCFQRSHGEHIPGCTGKGGGQDWDYCYNPNLGNSNNGNSHDIVLSGGNSGSAKNLKACTGECDADSQCAKGLKCFQRSHGEHIPGCTGKGGGVDWDYCYNPKLGHKTNNNNNNGGSHGNVLGGKNDGRATNLQACWGECDADAQCAKGLKCFQRSKGEPIPGCTGKGGGKDWDYCYHPQLGGQHDIVLSGGNDGGAKNLKACTGECDADSQCAFGLKCFQRSKGEKIPGCTGKGGGKDWDYCYNPSLGGKTNNNGGSHDIVLSGGNNGKAKNLKACKGECDADSQCTKGLKCFQRSHGEKIPGCTGKGGGADWDYCYNPRNQVKVAKGRERVLLRRFLQPKQTIKTRKFLSLMQALHALHAQADSNRDGHISDHEVLDIFQGVRDHLSTSDFGSFLDMVNKIKGPVNCGKNKDCGHCTAVANAGLCGWFKQSQRQSANPFGGYGKSKGTCKFVDRSHKTAAGEKKLTTCSAQCANKNLRKRVVGGRA